MKSAIPTLICGLALTHTLSAQSIVNNTNNPGLFGGSPSSITVDPPNAPLLGLELGGSVGPTALGNYWNASASGGASASLLGLGLLESGAQVALTGSSLQFNLSNGGVVGNLLGAGLSLLPTTWSATGTFNNLNFTAGQAYQVSFFVDGSNGLLNSTLAIAPSFTVELLDGAGNPIASNGSGTLINLVGLLGTGVTTGTVTLDFVAPVGVNGGPGGIRFNGSSVLNATALNLGTNYATISNLNISAVPEPSALMLGAVGALGLLRRRRH